MRHVCTFLGVQIEVLCGFHLWLLIRVLVGIDNEELEVVSVAQRLLKVVVIV